MTEVLSETLENELFDELKEVDFVNNEGTDSIDLERALLILSGLDTQGIDKYKAKLDILQNNFAAYLQEKYSFIGINTERKAIALDNYLNETKPKRAVTKRKINKKFFLLKNVVDSQLHSFKYKKVGDCTGLDSLYTVLGLREDLDVSILIHFNPLLGNHIRTRVRFDGEKKDIEHLHLPFNYPHEKEFVEYPACYLIPIVLSNRGNFKVKKKDYSGALQDFSRVIKLDPEFNILYAQRGLVKIYLKDYEGAVEDFNKSIESDETDFESYFHRGNAKLLSKDYNSALDDLNHFLIVCPKVRERYQTLCIAHMLPPRDLSIAKLCGREYLRLEGLEKQANKSRGIAEELATTK